MTDRTPVPQSSSTRPPAEAAAAAALVLVPGHWLGAWAWDDVAAALRAKGHRVLPLTLPGLESAQADRSHVSLDDHVAAVVGAVASAGAPVVLVAHSGGGTVVTAAANRVAHLVRRMVFVESGPQGDGTPYDPDLDPSAVERPLPSWDELRAGGGSTDGLSDEQLAEFRARAVPHPAGPLREPVELGDPALASIPLTEVCSSFSADDVRGLVAAGHPMFRPLQDYDDVTYVDLPTGHWPMWSRPDDLAGVLHEAATAGRE